MSIVTSLLNENFLEINKTDFIGLFCHGNPIYVSLTIKKPNFVLLTWLLPYLEPKDQGF